MADDCLQSQLMILPFPVFVSFIELIYHLALLLTTAFFYLSIPAVLEIERPIFCKKVLYMSSVILNSF